MGRLFGALAKSEIKGKLNEVIKLFQMKNEAKETVKGESAEKKVAKQLMKDIFKKHAIDKVKMDENKANEIAEKVVDKSFRLLMNDLIALKTLVLAIDNIIDDNHKIIDKINEQTAKISRGKIVDMGLIRDLKRKKEILEKENVEFNKDLKYVREHLGNLRTYCEDMHKMLSGGSAAILALKSKGFIDIALYNRFRMKREINRELKHLLRLQDGVKTVENFYGKMKAGKFDEKDLKELVTAERKAVKDARKSSVVFFELAEQAYIIRYIFVKTIRKEMQIEKLAAGKFEIPKEMDNLDEQAKEKIFKVMAIDIEEEHKSILQEWQLAKAA